MFCVKCGHPLAENARFCEQCGAAVAAPAAPVQPEMPVYVPSAAPAQPEMPADAPVEEPKRNVAKFVFSIIALAAGCLSAFYILLCMLMDKGTFVPVALFCGIAGVVFGCIGISEGKKGFCIPGIITGGFSVLISFLYFLGSM